MTAKYTVYNVLHITKTFEKEQPEISYQITCRLYGVGRNDFGAGKSISRAIGRGGP